MLTITTYTFTTPCDAVDVSSLQHVSSACSAGVAAAADDKSTCFKMLGTKSETLQARTHPTALYETHTQSRTSRHISTNAYMIGKIITHAHRPLAAAHRTTRRRRIVDRYRVLCFRRVAQPYPKVLTLFECEFRATATARLPQYSRLCEYRTPYECLSSPTTTATTATSTTSHTLNALSHNFPTRRRRRRRSHTLL